MNPSARIIDWRYDKCLGSSSAQELFAPCKVLSLDIFDTLLLRACEKPSDIFRITGEKAEKSGVCNYSPKQFEALRIYAEKRAYEQLDKGSEISINEIYEQLPERVGDKQRILELELETEKEFCYINPIVMSLVEESLRKNKRIILVSNMYLAIDTIKDILRSVGFGISVVEDIFVSSEVRKRKNDGSLFSHILSELKDIRPSEIVHIGDNYSADIAGAERVGIRAIHYDNRSLGLNNAMEREKIKYDTLYPELSSLRKVCSGIQFGEQDDQLFYSLGQTVLGPAFAIFAEWVVDLAIQEQASGIYPLMREGELFTTLIAHVVKARQLNIEVKPLFVSRQSTYLAGLDTYGEQALISVFSRRHFSVRNLFELFELDITNSPYSDYHDTMLSNSHEVVLTNGEVLREALISFFKEDTVISHINGRIDRNRAQLLKYFEQIITKPGRAITVDLGFEGTIQSAISRAVANSRMSPGIQFIHALMYGAAKNKEHLFNHVDIRGFAGNFGENADFIRGLILSSEVLEQLLMGDCGSTNSYRYDQEKKIVPVLDENEIPKDEIAMKKKCQEGMIVFQNLFLQFLKQKPELRNRLYNQKEAHCKVINRLLDFPTREEAEHLCRLHYDENFGSTIVLPIMTDKDKQLLSKVGPDDFERIGKGGYRFSSILWPQGVITAQYPHYLLQKNIENSSGHSAYLPVIQLVQQVILHSIDEVNIYGAGEVGDLVYEVLMLYDVKVQYFIDQKSTLWGTKKNEIEIISLKKAIERNVNHCYIIASFSFVSEIKQQIERQYRQNEKEATIFNM